MSRIQKLIERARETRSAQAGAQGDAELPRSGTAPPRVPASKLASAGSFDWSGLQQCKLPRGEKADSRVILDQDNTAGASSYKMLRTRVLQRMRSNQWQSIAISSLMPSEGKTLTSINLAISIARDPSMQCTLVEMDLRAPSLASYLQLNVPTGIEDFLLGQAPLADAVMATSEHGLYMAAVRNRQQNSSELLSATSAREMVSVLASSPSMIVIYDLPPILQADDLLAFAPLVDAVLLVVAEGQTKREELAQARDIFTEMNLLGVVLNKSNDSVDSLGY